jgi:WD40 repeat protein
MVGWALSMVLIDLPFSHWTHVTFKQHVRGIGVSQVVAAERQHAVCDRKLEGHTRDVPCLAVSGTRLVSGSWDRSVKVWAMGAGALWPYERTLVGHADWVYSLVTWLGKVLSGSRDQGVGVWDMGTGARQRAKHSTGAR